MNDNDIKFELFLGCLVLPLMLVFIIPMGFISVGYSIIRYIYNNTINKLWQKIKARKRV